ncbi:hypothetical protein QYE76_064288 [Lolium multiflorum]|uniref:Reverse transcriptase n=1 Tax=Lolium multiflorum TaxID=4521 RepID=A0AAD8S817_LOLMU|nr:hypothetical protein QYE76_064288 [Lolium multiflorum]
MDDRRAKGPCFNCDEKFVRGHRCKRLFYIQSVGDEEEPLADAHEEAKISLLVVTRIPTSDTMQVAIRIGDRDLVALLDSGSRPAYLHVCEDRALLDSLLAAFSDVFTEPQGLPPPRAHDHHIHLIPGTQPIVIQPYRYPAIQKDELERQCAEMLARGLIRQSSSAFSSLVLLVRKHDGTWRFCIDFCGLNMVTIKDKFPIPVVDELLDELKGARFFTKLDLRSGYHQVRMAPEDIHKTAFCTHEGLFEFVLLVVRPPSPCQARLGGYAHTSVVSQALQVLFWGGIYGHVISAEGVAMDSDKVLIVVDWPTPRTVRAVRGFLGFAGYYHKFIKGFGTIAAPLTALLKKDGFFWTDQAATAFEALKMTEGARRGRRGSQGGPRPQAGAAHGLAAPPCGVGAPQPLSPPFLRVLLRPENLSHGENLTKGYSRLCGAENTREKRALRRAGIRRGNSLPEGEIDAIAIVIELDIISIIIIIISTIYTAITTAAPRHRCNNLGISMNEVRKKLFTISLSGKAAHWYKLLKNGDSIDWEDIVPLFYSKFYPPSEIHKDRNRIYNFWPHDGESIAQAWGRLKSLMLKCPIHELPGNVIIDNFYARLSFQDKTLLDTSCSGSFTRNKEEFKRDLLDRIQENTEGWENDKDRESAAGGTFMSITLGAATKLLDDMMINYSEWHTERAPQGKKVNSVEETSSLSDKIDVIMSMLVNGRSNVDPNNVPLASLVAQEENVDVNFIKNNNFNNNAYRNNSGNNYRPYPSANGNGYGNSYGNSYNNNRSVPSGLEAMLKEFISTQTAFNKSVEEKLDKIDTIASRVDRLASDVNLLKLKVMPNNDIDNKITTTANAIQVRINENIRLMAELRARWDREENEKLAKENNVAKVWTITTTSNANSSHVAAPPTINGKIIGVGNVSTPSAKRTKLPEIAKTAETACDKTAEIFSNLGNNDPIAVAHNDLDFDDCHISEVIKFLQKLAKSPNASAINLAFTKHITNALIKAREEKLKLETSIPRKLEDGWEPIIKMKFNDFECNALCDLGASISVMPKKIYDMLDLPPLKNCYLDVNLADNVKKKPLGRIDNVHITVNNNLVPVDFVVLDIECNASCPIVLGRPFLRTVGAVIDMREVIETVDNVIPEAYIEKTPFPAKMKEYSVISSAVNKSEKKPKEPEEQIKIEPAVAIVKDLVTENVEDGHIIFCEDASNIVSHPNKPKQVSVPMLSVRIGDHCYYGLCDIGASVSAIPYELYTEIMHEIDSCELEDIDVVIQLANRETISPIGIVRDVEVLCGKIKYHADFLVLGSAASDHCPIIFGRPFLNTCGAIIDCKKEKILTRFAGEPYEFNFSKFTKTPYKADLPSNDFKMEQCASIVLVPNNPLQQHLENSESEAFRKERDELEEIFLRQPILKHDLPVEDLGTTPPPKEDPVFDLKPLPDNLKYAHIDDKKIYPVIISSKLSEIEEERLLEILKKHRGAIGYTLDDLKGISPSICQHAINMEDDAKPVVEHQRRLIPKMKEVVRNEVLKLLEAGIIYPIADSRWVSPVHCVPKKGGMTVVPNDNDELIPQRIVVGCMSAIFHGFCESIVEVFMDDFSVYGNSFDNCLRNLDKVLQRCEETNLVLNWEKCHFMVNEGIVLGHKISERGIEVDRAKVEAIEKMPYPRDVKGIRSVLGHAGFYRRFIKDFSKISKPLTNLLQKDVPFVFDDDCKEAFETLKKALTTAPVVNLLIGICLLKLCVMLLSKGGNSFMT